MEMITLSEEQRKEAFSMATLVFNPQALAGISQIAGVMANTVGLPDHYRNNVESCMALIMQCGKWGIDPFGAAQKTFVLSGKVGYEAQLIQAVAEKAGWHFETEYKGDWSKVTGKFRNEKNAKGNWVPKPTWSNQDEESLSIIVTGTNKTNGKSHTIEVLMRACQPRNSTNWVYDPAQQIHYAAIKKFTRRHCSGVVMGINDYDDLAARESVEKVINPKENHSTPKSLNVMDIINKGALESEQVQKEEAKPLSGEVVSGKGDIDSEFQSFIDSALGSESLDDIKAIKADFILECGKFNESQIKEFQSKYKSQFKLLSLGI